LTVKSASVPQPNLRLPAMSQNDLAAPPWPVAPRNVQQASKRTEHRSAHTVVPVISLRERRAGARRLPELESGYRDPLDDLAEIADGGQLGAAEDSGQRPWPRQSAARQVAAEDLAAAARTIRRLPAPRQVEWGGYDVTTLGLDCSHSDGRCAGRRREAV
jgi:hypothetical protein